MQTNRQTGIFQRLAGWLILALALATAAPLWAADTTTCTWNQPGGGALNWSPAGNWTGNSPTNGGNKGYILWFPNGGWGTVSASNDFSIVPFILNSLVCSNAGETLLLYGNDIQFSPSAGGIQPTIAEGSSQGATVNNNIILVTNLTAAGTSTGTIGLGGSLNGVGSLTKSGPYQLTLSGTNTYSGGTYLNAGSLGLGTNQALGANRLTISGGTLLATKPVTVSNDVWIAGECAIGGAANLTLSNLFFAAPHTLTNLNTATTIIAGTNGGAGTLFAGAGSLILSNSVNTSNLFLQAAGGGITLVGGGTFGLGFSTINTAAVIGLPGTVTLNPISAGNTSFAFGTVTNGPAAMGTLAVNTGIAGSTNLITLGSLVRVGRSTLAVTPQNGLGSREQVSISSGVDPVNGILPPWIVSTTNGGEFLSSPTDLTNATYTVTLNPANGTNSSTPSATDIVKVLATTTLTNTISAFALNVQSGLLNLNGNTLNLGSGAYGGLILTNGIAISNGGNLALSGTETLAYTGSGNNGVIAANLSGASALTKFGTGTLSLSNFATLYTGDTMIDAGALSFNPSQNFSWTNNIDGAGTLVKDGTNVFTVLNSTGTVGGVTVNKGMLVFSGGARTDQSAPVIASGATLLLTNGVQYVNLTTGATFTINAGTMNMVGNTNLIGFKNAAGPVNVAVGGTVWVGPGASLALTNLTAMQVSASYGDGNNLLRIGGVGAQAFVTNPVALNVGYQAGNNTTLIVTNASVFAASMSIVCQSSGGGQQDGHNNGAFINSNATVNLNGGSLVLGQGGPQGTNSYLMINAGAVTNVGSVSVYAYQGVLTVNNGGSLFCGNVLLGMGGGPSNSYNVGGGSALTTVSNGTIGVGSSSGSGQNGGSFAQLTITNANLLSGATTIGNAAIGGNNVGNCRATVLAGANWNLLGGNVTVGIGSSTRVATNNALTVNGGVMTNAGTLTIGSGVSAAGNSAILTNGGQVYATGVSIGASSSNNTLLVTAGTLLEAGLSLTVGATNSFTNAGGVLQFTNVAPTITGNSGLIVITNGTVSFRAVTNANVNGNTGGTQLTNLTFFGNNAFRLNWATNSATTNQSYVFDPGLGATNYYRLEMVNGSTCYRGQSTNALTIGLSVGSGGQMLCSNTAALVTIPFTNNGTLTLVNSTLTFATNAVINGTVTIDMNRLGATNGVLLANKNLTLGKGSTLVLTGTATNLTLGTVSGTLSGTFGTVQGLPGNYVVVNHAGQISVQFAPPGTCIFLK
jgi:autotransporter-associated beta strand protein